MGRRLPYRLPQRLKTILLFLAKALINEPADLVVQDKEGAYLRRCEIMLGEFHWLNRFFFVMTIYFFDRAAFLFGFGLARFIHLKPESQKKYLHFWLTTKSVFLREAFKGIRGIAMMAYFSHPDVWQYIGYDPKAFVAERIRLREELMRRGGSGGGTSVETTSEFPRSTIEPK